MRSDINLPNKTVQRRITGVPFTENPRKIQHEEQKLSQHNIISSLSKESNLEDDKEKLFLNNFHLLGLYRTPQGSIDVKRYFLVPLDKLKMLEGVRFDDVLCENEIKKDIECGVCFGYVMLDGIQCRECDHLLCKDCSSKLRKCPYCSRDISSQPKICRQVKSLMRRQSFKCLNQNCGFVWKEEEYINHVKTCSDLLMKKTCPNDGCHKLCNKKEMEDHLKACEQEQTRCKSCHRADKKKNNLKHSCYLVKLNDMLEQKLQVKEDTNKKLIRMLSGRKIQT